jgi:hypothetical protein
LPQRRVEHARLELGQLGKKETAHIVDRWYTRTAATAIGQRATLSGG